MTKLPTWGGGVLFLYSQLPPMSGGGERQRRVDIVEKVADQLI
jgi:hypothetical protein